MDPSSTDRKGEVVVDPEPRRGALRMAIDHVFGHDFFISYRWSDGSAYSRALYERLKADYVCFLDREGFGIGDDLKWTTKRVIAGCGMLIVVGTRSAVGSRYVLSEVEQASRLGKSIIPIDVGGALSEAHSAGAFAALGSDPIFLREDVARLGSGPSDEIIAEIRRSYTLVSRFRKRMRVFATAALTFAVLAAVAVALALAADRARRDAQHQARRSRSGELAAGSVVERDEFPRRSLLLALEALAVTQRAGEPRVLRAEQSLRDGLATISGRPLAGSGTSSFLDLAVSRDGHQVAAGGPDGSVRLWDIRGDETSELHPRALPGARGRLRPLRFSRGGDVLIALDEHDSDNRLLAWVLDPAQPEPRAVVLLASCIEATVSASPDGRWLFAASGKPPGRSFLWDLQGREPRRNVLDLGGSVDAASLGETTLVVSSPSEGRTTIRRYRLTDAGLGPEVGPPLSRDLGSFIALHLSPDGSWLVADGSDRDELWDLGREPAGGTIDVEGDGGASLTVAFSRDGHWLAATRLGREVSLFDLSHPGPVGRPRLLRGHTAAVLSLEFSPDGRWLGSGGLDRTVRLWPLGKAGGRGSDPLILRGLEGSPTRLVFPMAHDLLVAASLGDGLRTWPLDRPDPESACFSYGAGDPDVTAVAADPRGAFVVFGHEDGAVRVVYLDREGRVRSVLPLEGHRGPIRSVAIHPESPRIATASKDGTLRLWEVDPGRGPSGSTLLEVGGPSLFKVSFADAGRRLVAIGQDVRIWDLPARPWGHSLLALKVGSGAIVGGALSVDGRRIAVQTDEKKVELWDLEAGGVGRHLAWQAHREEPIAIAMSPDGRWLATSGQETTVRLWRLDSANPGRHPIPLAAHENWVRGLAFSPDGRWLATGGVDELACLWDLTAADPSAAPIRLPALHADAEALAFSPDGRRLFVGGWDILHRPFNAFLWEMTGIGPIGAPIVLRGAEGEWIKSCAISGDGRWVVTGGDHGHIWPLRLEELGTMARRVAGRELRPDERARYAIEQRILSSKPGR